MRALLAVVLMGALPAGAQALRFEVASVKPGAGGPGAGVHGGCRGIDSKYSSNPAASAPPLGRCVIADGRLGHLVSIAWDLGNMQLIKGGPEWVLAGSDRFTVEAKAEDPAKTTEAQLLEMLRNALVERFKMKFHREMVQQAGFALVIGKNGPKLGAGTGDESGLDFGSQGKPAPGGPVNLKLRKYSTAELASLLSNFATGPVADRTGLTGEYDFTLNWDEANGPALTTALQEQLGLKLEPAKVALSLFVIDSAEKPEQD